MRLPLLSIEKLPVMVRIPGMKTPGVEGPGWTVVLLMATTFPLTVPSPLRKEPVRVTVGAATVTPVSTNSVAVVSVIAARPLAEDPALKFRIAFEEAVSEPGPLIGPVKLRTVEDPLAVKVAPELIATIPPRL